MPVTGSGPADPAQARVVRGWADALRSGDIGAATRFWGTPAQAQNATPLLLLRSRRAVRAFNEGLTCGARVTRVTRAGAYVIAEFRLAERPGGACGPAVGAPARSALRIRDGRIVEWYRLPDQPGGGGAQEPVPSGPII